MTEKEFSNIHQQVWGLLPWYINQTLSPEEDGMVENHLSTCLVCRNELAQQQLVKQAVTMEHTEENAVNRSLSSLHQRIKNQSTPSELGAAAWLNRAFKVLRDSHFGIQTALLAQAAVIVVIVFVAVDPSSRPDAEYTTLTSEQSQEFAEEVPAIILTVIFAEDLTIIGLQKLLEDHDLAIKSGPSPAGAYKLSKTRADQSAVEKSEQLIKRLQSHPSVLFVSAN